MLCEHYKDALIEAAATGGTPQGQLRAHLAACASCRAAFEQEQSLFAVIDAGLQSAANAQVPPSLLPRVRAAVDDMAVFPQLRWLKPLVLASASVAFVLAIFLIARPHHAEPLGEAKEIPTIPAPEKLATDTVKEDASSVVRIVSAAKPPHAWRHSTLLHAAASSNPEVLVPPEERVAFARFLSRDQGFEAQASVSASWTPKAPQESVQILPVEIASLKVKPLSKGEEDQNQQTEFEIR